MQIYSGNGKKSYQNHPRFVEDSTENFSLFSGHTVDVHHRFSSS